MKKMILRADDLGFSRAVNYGIYDSVKAGLIQSVGVMVNMEASEHGAELLKQCKGCCFGLHTNFSAGKPVSPPEAVPSLVDEKGEFYGSARYRSAERDFITYEDAKKEIDAQYRRFEELFGMGPAYFEAHAVKSSVMMRALEDYAGEHGLLYHAPFAALNVNGFAVPMYLGDITDPDYDPYKELKACVDSLEEGVPKMYVFHPGYLDQPILRMSSLTLNRTKEVQMLTDPAVGAYLEGEGVRLYSYETIVEEIKGERSRYE